MVVAQQDIALICGQKKSNWIVKGTCKRRRKRGTARKAGKSALSRCSIAVQRAIDITREGEGGRIRSISRAQHFVSRSVCIAFDDAMRRCVSLGRQPPRPWCRLTHACVMQPRLHTDLFHVKLRLILVKRPTLSPPDALSGYARGTCAALTRTARVADHFRRRGYGSAQSVDPLPLPPPLFYRGGASLHRACRLERLTKRQRPPSLPPPEEHLAFTLA